MDPSKPSSEQPWTRFAHWPARWPFLPDVPAPEGRKGMVATTDRYATRVGVKVLEAGGNAVDAAVAVSLALAVVNPEAGNLGGSGFTLIRGADGAVAALDFRSVAPAGATADMFTGPDRAPFASELGHLAVAVPGSVRGLWDAHLRFGSMAWERLVSPAVELARGFVVEHRLVRSYPPHIVAALGRFPASAEIFLPGGAVPREGDTFRQPDLARTLERIRDGGADGFYRGETADLLVDEMRRGGGILTHEDLARYTSEWREPVRFRYRDHTMVSMPPSSSGGVTLAAMGRILGRWDLGALPWHGPRHVHLLVEACKRAYADRNHYLADPAHVEVPVDVLTDDAYGAWRAESVRPGTATPAGDVRPGVEEFVARRARLEDARGAGPAGGATPGGAPPAAAPPPEGSHTTHVSIVDAQGGAVSLTTTLNTWYGSKVVARGTGVLLNNEMDDFTARPGVPNHFGLIQGEANRVAPGKRMLSAMTPTMVLDPEGRLSMVVGTPGGATIMTTVFQVVSNVLDHGMTLAEAVAAPRVHHQHLPDRIQLEPDALPSAVVEELRSMGHDLLERPELPGDVQAVRVCPDGTLEGAADPRRGGVAEGR